MTVRAFSSYHPATGMVRPFPTTRTGQGRHGYVRLFVVAALLMAGAAGADAGQAPVERLQVRATRTERAPTIDGRLDEPEWMVAEPVGDFMQSDPGDGDPLTEPTQVRVLYDRDNLYISAYMYDREPRGIVVGELLRDFDSHESDAFGLAIDPLNDRRNAFTFFTNPGAAKRDLQSLEDGRYTSLQWDGVWYAGASILADGWVAEVAIPFKTLGVRSASVSTMGINFKRRIRRKNEEGYWSYVPRRFTVSYMTNAGSLVGLGEVATGGNLRVKPYGKSDVRWGPGPSADDAFDPQAGLDVKYRLGQGVAVDLTLNTDFSQVEVDRQQVNLTRFNLFFPEKRDFFLENAGLFTLGDVPNQRSTNSRGEETQLLYTRRIGLSPRGQPLPLLGGARLSGRTGPYSVGLMNIQQRATDDYESNNFTIARIRRDLIDGVDAGGMVVHRQGGGDNDYNLAYGVDVNSRFLDRLWFNGYAAQTRSPGVESRNTAAQASAEWEDGFLNVMFLAATIGERFDPQVGFVPRPGVRNYQLTFGLHPRPKGWPLIREIHPHTNIKLYDDWETGTPESKDQHYGLELAFHDGGRIEVSVNPQFERLTSPFRLPNGVSVAPGDYRFHEYRLAYSTDKSRLLYGSLNVEDGGYYDGDRNKTSAALSLSLKPKLTAQVSYEYNRADVLAGSYRAELYGLRSLYSFSPRMFLDAYVQYNSSTDTTVTNVRYTFTYRPLSDFIVVYNENLTPDGGDKYRAFVVKLTRLFQF